MKPEVEEFVKSKRFAVVGVSRDQKKFGNTIYKELKSRGYEVFGVNPSMREIEGEKCFQNVSELRDRVDAAVVCLKPDSVEPILREAAEAGIHLVWLQQGAQSRRAFETGKSLGLNVIGGKCILMYTEPVHSYHAFHRFFVKLFGKY